MAFAFINKIKAYWNNQDNCLENDEEETLEVLCQDFFAHLFKRYAPDTVTVQSLQAYSYKGMYYFHVRFAHKAPSVGQAEGLELVYYGSDSIENHINLGWSWWEGREKYRDMYREAVSKGGQKVYSQEEIARYIRAHLSEENQTIVS